MQSLDERIVRGRGAVVVEPEDDSGERFPSAELIVGCRATAGDILQKAAAAVVAEDDVELAVRTKAQHAAVMIATRRLAGVLLQRAQLAALAAFKLRPAGTQNNKTS